MPDALRVALLGCGVVGSAVASRLQQHHEDFAARIGAPLELVGVLVRDVDRPRPDSGVDPALFTTDGPALVARADLVVEVMGGIEPARGLLLRAMKHGAAVVTANKALLGQDGPTLYEAADAAGVDLYFEAAVAGAIPLVRPLRESIAGDSVRRVTGIVNGTTNFILDRMDRTGASLADALQQAQQLGYAEADPTADVDGLDARAKAAIIASLAFHTRVHTGEVHCEGIMGITAEDIRAARKIGCLIKLLAICETSIDPSGSAGINVRVHPALLPRQHPLATVHDAFNAVFVETELAGPLMFYGQGAGGTPTSSAVLGDLVHAARHRVRGVHGPGESAYRDLPVRGIGTAHTGYFVRLDVQDRPGVLGQVASVIASQGVSIESIRQGRRRSQDGLATLHLVTHPAEDAALARTVEQLRTHPDVAAVASVLRVEGL